MKLIETYVNGEEEGYIYQKANGNFFCEMTWNCNGPAFKTLGSLHCARLFMKNSGFALL